MQMLLFRRRRAAFWILVMGMVIGSLGLHEKGERKQMLGYMEQKYGEAFTVQEPYAGQFGKDYTMLKVRSLKGRIDGILVRAVKEKENIIYQDNYLAYLLRGKAEQRIRALAEPVFGECKVFYKIPEMVFPTEFPADMDVEAFLRHPQSMVRMYFYIRNISSDPQGQFEQFLSVLQGEGYVIGGVISYPIDKRKYQMISRANFTRDIYLGYRYSSEAVFSMDEKGALAYLEWKE